jgi:hypothetical protein
MVDVGSKVVESHDQTHLERGSARSKVKISPLFKYHCSKVIYEVGNYMLE